MREDGQHNVISYTELARIVHVEILDGGPDCFDNACSLMTEHDRCGQTQFPTELPAVCLAQAAGGDADEHFTRARRIEVERIDRKPRATCGQHCPPDLHPATLRGAAPV